MKVSGVDIDPQILNALESNNLVVFAGAGVSMGPPCNLDNFVTLAKKIGEGTDLEFTDNDKNFPEVYLGKLKSKGVKIYERLHENLLKPDSSFTPLHLNLVRLFNDSEKCRIITTNYDLFFETAFEHVFGKTPKTYISPALPLGKDFNGIVHVHGALNSDKGGIVIGDDDFGRAYLTEGWARRFLRDVFENYTVLFVGYSHDDTVMKYLARGLPPSNEFKRFVLTGTYDELDHWEHLGIETIEYPQRGKNDYDSLNNSVEQLANLNAKGALDLEKRISEIVSSPSELDEENESQLHWYLSKEYTTRFFCKHAEDIEWLNWANKNGYLFFLFKQNELDEREIQLAQWFSKFALKDYQRALEIFTSKSRKPNTQVIRSISSSLIFAEKEEVSKQMYNAWFPVLEPYLDDWHDIIHPNLFQNIESIEANEVLLFLFNAFTEPQAKIGPYFSLGFNEEEGRRIDYEINFYVDHYILEEAYKNQIKPKIDELAYYLLDEAVNNLLKAYLLNKSWEKSNEHYDRLSRNRSAIEPHEQDKYPEIIDVLINTARDIIEYFVANKPNYALSKIETLVQNESSLIKRIAIHGLCALETLSAKEKLRWVIENRWLSDIELKHEVYRLIAKAFPKITEGEKDKFLEEFFSDLRKLFDHSEDEDKEKHITYQKFNLLKWIEKFDEDSGIVKKRLESIVEHYPEFETREYLDLISWTSSASWGSGIEPIKKETLLSKSAEKALEYILEELPDSEYDKESKLSGLTEACREDIEWGKKFAQKIQEKNIEDNFIIDSIIKAWINEGLNALLKDDIFDFISDQRIQKPSVRILSRHLQSLSEREDLELSHEELVKFEQLINSLWQFSEEVEVGLENSSWLERAINHPAGNLVLTWIKIISFDYKSYEGGSDLTQKILDERFIKIIRDQSESGKFGKAILCSQFDFLLGIDDEWTSKNILPLFDFIENKNAEVAWDGWLSWGRLTQRNLEVLLPHYKSAIEFLAQDNQKKKFNFASHIADLVLFVLDDPIEEILNDYVSKASDNSRVDLVNQISNRIKNLVPEKKKYHWENWIKDFIHQRIQSVPKPLNSGEYEGILIWIINLEPVFVEAVELFIQSGPVSFESSSVFHRLLDSELIENNPNQVIELTLHILGGDLNNYFCYQLKKVYERLEDLDKSGELYSNLGNRLAEIGCL